MESKFEGWVWVGDRWMMSSQGCVSISSRCACRTASQYEPWSVSLNMDIVRFLGLCIPCRHFRCPWWDWLPGRGFRLIGTMNIGISLVHHRDRFQQGFDFVRKMFGEVMTMFGCDSSVGLFAWLLLWNLGLDWHRQMKSWNFNIMVMLGHVEVAEWHSGKALWCLLKCCRWVWGVLWPESQSGFLRCCGMWGWRWSTVIKVLWGPQMGHKWSGSVQEGFLGHPHAGNCLVRLGSWGVGFGSLSQFCMLQPVVEHGGVMSLGGCSAKIFDRFLGF